MVNSEEILCVSLVGLSKEEKGKRPIVILAEVFIIYDIVPFPSRFSFSFVLFLFDFEISL